MPTGWPIRQTLSTIFQHEEETKHSVLKGPQRRRRISHICRARRFILFFAKACSKLIWEDQVMIANRTRYILALTAAGLLAATAPALAEIVSYKADLNGASEVPLHFQQGNWLGHGNLRHCEQKAQLERQLFRSLGRCNRRAFPRPCLSGPEW